MNMHKKRKIRLILLAAFLLFAAAGIYAYREFHRTKPSGAELKAERVLTAAQLIAEFSTDDKAATAAHAGHALEVEGLFKKVDLSDSSHPVIVMADSSSSTSIRFSLDSSFHADLSMLRPGMPLDMKGVCIGFQPDDMGLGADILFDRSVILTTENPKL